MKTQYPLHHHTFGGSRAAEVLAELLSEHQDDGLTSKVSTYLKDHNMVIKSIIAIPDINVRGVLLALMQKKIKDAHMRWPEKVCTYTKNVAQSKIKVQLACDRELILDKQREISRLRNLRNASK